MTSVTGCLSVSAFTSLVGILIRIIISAVELDVCTLTAGIKKYKWIIKKKKKEEEEKAW